MHSETANFSSVPRNGKLTFRKKRSAFNILQKMGNRSRNTARSDNYFP